MSKMNETLHEKRKTTEDHIRQLEQEGKQGVRYTATMPDIPFLILGLLSDIGWLIHLCGRHYLLLRKRISPCPGLHSSHCIGRCRIRRRLHYSPEQNTRKGYCHKTSEGFRLWRDCLFRIGRGCYRNIADGAVCGRFTGTCVAGNWRLLKLCFRTADLSFI